eukprot:c9468_g1_i1.p1 GENE.c9468_g1_i1~~c9468_g1_i1.p1  ORF type:complete len:286 (-),score=55.00 c9468_g1_i1:23-880(-)
MVSTLLVDCLHAGLVFVLMASVRLTNFDIGNVKTWLVVLFWIQTVATVIHVPIIHKNLLNADVIRVFFNWAGCLSGTISTISPLRFALHYSTNRFPRFEKIDSNFVPLACTATCAVYLIVGIASLVSTDFEDEALKRLLEGWRIVFFINSAIEIVVLVWGWIVIHFVTDSQANRNAMRNFLIVTAYMRIGIAVTIAFKHYHVFTAHTHEVMHIFFSVTGIAAYFWHLRMLPCLKKEPVRPSLHKQNSASSMTPVVVYPTIYFLREKDTSLEMDRNEISRSVMSDV